MSLITGTANVGFGDTLFVSQITGYEAGEAIKKGAMCYIKSDGKVYECLATTGSSASAAPMGVASRQANSGEFLTLYGEGTIMQYGTGLTPGAILYLANLDAGYYDSAATNGDDAGVLLCLDAENVKVIRADGRKVGK